MINIANSAQIILILFLYLSVFFIGYRDGYEREVHGNSYWSDYGVIVYLGMMYSIVIYDISLIPSIILIILIHMIKRIGRAYGTHRGEKAVIITLRDVGIEYIVRDKIVEIKTEFVGAKTYRMIDKSVEHGERVTSRMVDILRDLHISDKIRIATYKDLLEHEYDKEVTGRTNQGAYYTCNKEVYVIPIFRAGDESRCFYKLHYTVNRIKSTK